MIDVPSNVIWIVGLVMLVCALAFLWNNRMSNHVASVVRLENEPHQQIVETVIDPHRYKAVPGLTPAAPAVTIENDEEPAGICQAEESVLNQDQAVQDDFPDNEDAQRMLNLAWMLEVHGDFEGRDEFSRMVIESTEASPRQRDRAQALLRNDSIA